MDSHCLLWKTLPEERLSVCPGTPFPGSDIGCAGKHGCFVGDVGLPGTNASPAMGGALFYSQQMAGHWWQLCCFGASDHGQWCSFCKEHSSQLKFSYGRSSVTGCL